MHKTAVYRNDLFLEHRPGFDHVESPERLKIIYEQLDTLESENLFVYPKFEPASLDTIGLNHTKKQIVKASSTAGKNNDFLDADTLTSEKSYDAALLAAGALVDGLKRIHAAEFNNCFCMVRPPGHHAESDRSMGFCLFNNVAIAAKYALSHLGMNRILILDWDLHHGNGTQHSFYGSEKVLYISTHQYPYYPGTGALLETGSGAGEGYTINIPLYGGQGDRDFACIFNDLVAPVTNLFKPQLILISCGFDIYKGDPLGGMQVTPAGFSYMTRVMVRLAEKLCDGKLLVTLEGGYNLQGMRDGCLAVLSELYGDNHTGKFPVFLDEKTNRNLAAVTGLGIVDQALNITKNYWKL